MTATRIDIDDEALAAAMRELGTTTECVARVLPEVGQHRIIKSVH